MKKYLFLLVVPILFFSFGCKKDCSCGEKIDDGVERILPWESPTGESYDEFWLVVENHCTRNIDTFYVYSIDSYNHYQNEKTFCEGSW